MDNNSRHNVAVICFYLSKYLDGPSDDIYEKFYSYKKIGFERRSTAVNYLSKKFMVKQSYIKNVEDEFDSVNSNHRKGWYQRPLRKQLQKIYDQYNSLNEEKMFEIVTDFISNKSDYVIYKPLEDFELSENLKIFSTEIPQANSLERIEKLVDFASKNIWRYYLIEEELGVVHRQVKYYVSAASLLGLVEGYKPHKITDIGTKFLSLNKTDKNHLLRELILKTKAMKIYLSLMDEDPNVIFENYKKFAVNINDNTLKRRLSNLRNWADFCNEVEPLPIKSDNPFDNIDDNETKTLSEIITIEKDEGKSSDARLRHNMLVDLMEEVLSKHDNVKVEKEWNNIDLVFENNDNLIFFEMKSITDENKGDQLKKALGQLIFYKNVVKKDAELVVVLESYFSDVDILDNDPINVVWKEGDSFNASEKTKEKLKVIFDQ